LVEGTPVSTTAGDHIVTFGAESVTPSAGGTVVPGDAIAVQAVIMAQANAGIIP
jgi:hypothetical protein